jgi:predicted nucleic acid-binding Zn ribbon protein
VNVQRIGGLLEAFIDKEVLQKAGTYSQLFSSWERVSTKCGLPAAAAHSRIAALERGILLVEADHPGWIQLLQTKQRELLDEFSRLLPDEIRGISFRLMRSGNTESAHENQGSAGTNEAEKTKNPL